MRRSNPLKQGLEHAPRTGETPAFGFITRKDLFDLSGQHAIALVFGAPANQWHIGRAIMVEIEVV